MQCSHCLYTCKICRYLFENRRLDGTAQQPNRSGSMSFQLEKIGWYRILLAVIGVQSSWAIQFTLSKCVAFSFWLLSSATYTTLYLGLFHDLFFRSFLKISIRYISFFYCENIDFFLALFVCHYTLLNFIYISPLCLQFFLLVKFFPYLFNFIQNSHFT